MASISPPALASAVNNEVGFAYTFAQIAIQRRLEDALNVQAAGLVRLVGDAAGSGSDVIRVTNIGGIGFNLAMSALASETAAITPSPFDLGYSTVTIADYGLAFEESYKAQILGREPAAMLDALVQTMPESFLRTLRDLTATTVAGFSTLIGSSGTALTMDNALDLLAAFRENPGSGQPVVMLHPKQVSDLVDSIRSETTLSLSVSEFGGLQGLQGGAQTIRNFAGLGFDISMSTSITDDTTDYFGGAYSAGGVGYAVGSTAGVRARGIDAIRIPEFGTIVTFPSSSSTNGKETAEARSFLGVAAGSSDVFVQRKVISKVAP
ncbi:MAG: hypothetical protein ACO3N4_02785 [Ilumatobacteraceae bacterium]